MGSLCELWNNSHSKNIISNHFRNEFSTITQLHGGLIKFSADVTSSPPWLWGRPTPSFGMNNSNNSHTKKTTPRHDCASEFVCIYSTECACFIYCSSPRCCLLNQDGYSQCAAEICQTLVNKTLLHVTSVPRLCATQNRKKKKRFWEIIWLP